MTVLIAGCGARVLSTRFEECSWWLPRRHHARILQQQQMMTHAATTPPDIAAVGTDGAGVSIRTLAPMRDMEEDIVALIEAPTTK